MRLPTCVGCGSVVLELEGQFAKLDSFFLEDGGPPPESAGYWHISCLQGSGYELMLMSTGYSQEREEQQLRAVLGWSPSGLVLTGRRHSRATETLVREARSAGVPVVEIWDRPSNGAASDDALLILRVRSDSTGWLQRAVVPDGAIEAEREEPGCLLAIAAGPVPEWTDARPFEPFVDAVAGGAWSGRASQLSEDHVTWTFVDEVAQATVDP